MKVICDRRHECKHKADCGGAQFHDKQEGECGECPHDKEAKCISLQDDMKLTVERETRKMDITNTAAKDTPVVAKVGIGSELSEANQIERESRAIKKKVLSFVTDGKSFTSVDIGNAIKSDRPDGFIRNRRVADWLRKNFIRTVYEIGALYNMSLIEVDVDGRPVLAYLYHRYDVMSDTYNTRDLKATPPRAEPSTELRDLLVLLSDAPESQLSPFLAKELEAMIDESVCLIVPMLKTILDKCAHDVLASDFAMLGIVSALKMAEDEAA